MSIHDELERIAARAPEVVVPPGTWARAQRARRRVRVGLVAVVVVLVALVGSVVWWPSRDGVEPVRTRAEVGVPSRLWSVPWDITEQDGDGGWTRDEVSDDPTDVGIGAAAWVAGWGLPVVVDANRGDYHLLDLPDFPMDLTMVSATDSPLALSPDGRQLAYSYVAEGAVSASGGIRVVDLTSGVVREIPVPLEGGSIVRHLDWSPDGLWLAFLADPLGWVTGEGPRAIGASRLVGRVPADSEAAEVQAISTYVGGVSVDAGGTVTFGAGPVRRWDGGEPVALRGPRSTLFATLGTLADGSQLRAPIGTADTPHRIDLIRPNGTRTRAIRIDTSVFSTLSVAVDLMDPAHPTIRRPEPEWPAEHPWLHAPALWVLIGLAAAALFARARARTRGRTLPRTAQSRWLGDESRRTGP